MCIAKFRTNKLIKALKLGLTALLLFIIVSTKESSSFNPRVDAWYSVEPWELEVCSKWGGTQEAQSGATSSKVVYLSQTTLSLQGRKQIYTIEGFNKTLYTASWYLEPLSDIGYRVELTNDDESVSFKISDGDASYSAPAVGYYSEYYDIKYTAIKMIYGLEWIKVPLINVE